AFPCRQCVEPARPAWRIRRASTVPACLLEGVMRLAWLLVVLPLVAGAQSLKTPTVPSEGVNPTQFGAKCDGTTDDAAAIAAAIESAKAKGVPVLLPAATCAYGAVLNLDGVKLIGRGDASTLWA